MRLVTSLFSACLLLAPPPGLAGGGSDAKPTVVVEIDDQVDEAVANALDHELEDLERFSVVSRTECDLDCVRGRDGVGPHAIVVEISGHEGDFAIKARSVELATERTISNTELMCELCGVRELGDTVRETVERLSRQLARTSVPAQVSIQGEPAGAVVMVDGARVGTTPLTIEVGPGPHQISLAVEGFAPRRYDIVTEASVKERLHYALTPLRAPPARDRPLKIAGWSGVTVGSAVLASAVTLVVLDGRPHTPSCNARDPAGACPNVYTTGSAGIGTAVIGSAVLATGLGLAIAGHVLARKRERTKLRLSARGIGVAF